MSFSHPIQRRYLAEDLVRLRRSDEQRRYVASQRAGRIDANPHQIEAVVFALSRLSEGGCILADEVGLGKTIEAGLVIAQRLAEGARRVLLVTPKPLLGQWKQELYALFGIETREGSAAAADSFAGPGVFLVGRELAGGEKGAAALAAAERFDLCVVDEAHEVFAGIYRRFDRHGEYLDDSPEATTAGRLRELLLGSGTPVLLLTATPIQNSLAELWGLVQYVDPSGTLLGDLPTFREMFCEDGDRVLAPGQEHELRLRMKAVLQRTLRRQAQEFMERPFVGRHPQLFEYTMSPEERQLYDDVTAYLLEPGIAAFRGNQRRLLLIGFHRRMASSLAALSASLAKVAERLRRMASDERTAHDEDAAAFRDDLEDEDLDLEADSSDGAPPPPAQVAAELARVESFIARAEKLPGDSKARALQQAVCVVLQRGDAGQDGGKVVLFTESLTTQDYLRRMLVESKLVSDEEVTLFRGNNDSPRAAAALARWQEEIGRDIPAYHRPSRDVAVRLALVHEFRTRSRVFISTEAGAKGLNLQFCSTLINYDLPWNPQRIEQRIGRCHRYGQKHDVTVINFLAKDNEAQRLTFEILSQKLELFGSVLGATDQVLQRSPTDAPENLVGALGAELETRMRRIYERARTADEIAAELRSLRDSLDERRNEFEEAHRRTADVIQSHFDESVQTIFCRIRDELPRELESFDRDLEGVVVRYLDAIGAPYRRESAARMLRLQLEPCAALPAGLRQGVTVGIGRSESLGDAEPLHLGHPLVGAALDEARHAGAGRFRVRIRVTEGPLTLHRGRSGRLMLAKVRHDGYEPSEKLIPLVLLQDEDGPLEAASAHELLLLPMAEDDSAGEASGVTDDDIADALELLVFDGSDDVAQSQQRRFDGAMAQIDRFAEDRLLLLRRRRSETERRIETATLELERAMGAQQRTDAETRLHRWRTEAEELDAKIARLEAREDDAYQRLRAQAHARRYAAPQIEQLLEADLRIE